MLNIKAWPEPKAMMGRTGSGWCVHQPAIRLVEPYRRKKRPEADPRQLELGFDAAAKPLHKPGRMKKKRALYARLGSVPTALHSAIATVPNVSFSWPTAESNTPQQKKYDPVNGTSSSITCRNAHNCSSSP